MLLSYFSLVSNNNECYWQRVTKTYHFWNCGQLSNDPPKDVHVLILQPYKCYLTWQRGTKRADGIKVVNCSNLKYRDHFLDYPGRPKVITRLLKCRREGRRRGQSNVKTLRTAVDFKDWEEGHKPRNVGSLWMLERARKQIILYLLQKGMQLCQCLIFNSVRSMRLLNYKIVK